MEPPAALQGSVAPPRSDEKTWYEYYKEGAGGGFFAKVASYVDAKPLEPIMMPVPPPYPPPYEYDWKLFEYKEDQAMVEKPPVLRNAILMNCALCGKEDVYPPSLQGKKVYCCSCCWSGTKEMAFDTDLVSNKASRKN